MYGKFPAAQWVEHCTANAVRVRIEILYRGTCRFVFFFFLLLFHDFFFEDSFPLDFFFEDSFSLVFYIKIRNNLECLCILVFLLQYIK